jgi:hypothetical protein
MRQDGEVCQDQGFGQHPDSTVTARTDRSDTPIEDRHHESVVADLEVQ